MSWKLNYSDALGRKHLKKPSNLLPGRVSVAVSSYNILVNLGEGWTLIIVNDNLQQHVNGTKLKNKINVKRGTRN